MFELVQLGPHCTGSTPIHVHYETRTICKRTVHILLRSCLVTAGKRSLRRLCFHRCLSVHRGGVSAPLHAGDTPAEKWMLGYGQQAGITHPTGMHSCSSCFCEAIQDILLLCVNMPGNASYIYYFFYIYLAIESSIYKNTLLNDLINIQHEMYTHKSFGIVQISCDN